jgi:hypothetical protein
MTAAHGKMRPADQHRIHRVRKSAAYHHGMGLFRSVTDLFRGKTGKNREKPAAELSTEQTATAELSTEQTATAELSTEQTATAELPTEQTATAELPTEQTATAELPTEQTGTAELPTEQTETVQEQPKAASRKPKYEARPDPDKAGWGLALGQDIFKVREDRASQE